MTAIFIVIGLIVLMFVLTVLFGAPYVPSRKKELKRAFEKLYRLGKGDFLVDVGSGDGVVLKAAAGYGASCLGYEINPVLWGFSKVRLIGEAKANVVLGNFLRAKLPEQTNVVYIFGVEHLMGKIYKKLQRFADEQKKTVKLISYGFEVPGFEVTKREGAYFLYEIVPKKPR